MKKLIMISALVSTAFLTACMQQQPYYGSAQPVYNNGGYYNNNGYRNNGNYNRYPQQPQSQGPSINCIAATAGGAIAGGVVGNQFGKGNGKKAAIAAGAVGGAMAGQQLGCN